MRGLGVKSTGKPVVVSLCLGQARCEWRFHQGTVIYSCSVAVFLLHPSDPPTLDPAPRLAIQFFYPSLLCYKLIHVPQVISPPASLQHWYLLLCLGDGVTVVTEHLRGSPLHPVFDPSSSVFQQSGLTTSDYCSTVPQVFSSLLPSNLSGLLPAGSCPASEGST